MTGALQANSLQRQYLRWSVVATVVAVIPLAVYHWHWASTILIEPTMFAIVTFCLTALLAWILYNVFDPATEAFVVSWFVVAFVCYLVLVIFVRPEVYGPDSSVVAQSSISYPLGRHLFGVGVAGVAGVALDLLGKQATAEYPSLLGPLATHKRLVLVGVLLVPFLIAGVSFATPPGTAIDDAEPEWGTYPLGDETVIDSTDRIDLYAFEVTLSLDDAAQRLVLETPSGESRSVLITPEDASRGADTAFVRAMAGDERSHELGTYTVTVESIWGQTLDRETIDIEREPALEMTAVDVSDESGTTFLLETQYTSEFPVLLQPFGTEYAIREEPGLELEHHALGEFLEDGESIERETTVVDADGEPVSLEPGTYTVDAEYSMIGWSLAIDSEFTLDVP